MYLMKKIFTGILFIFLNFNFTINDTYVIGLFPDFVGYIKDYKIFNEKLDLNEDEISTIAMPAIAGPGAFWKILEENTGYCEIEFDKNNNKISKINSISPSSTSDVAYLSYLMRMDYNLDDYSNFLEIHPSTDTNYKIIKNMWL